MKVIKYVLAFLALSISSISCFSDEHEIYQSPSDISFSDFTIDNNIQLTNTSANLEIGNANYTNIEVTFVDQIGVPFTPPKTEPLEGEKLEDLDNVFIPTITKIDDLHYTISGTRLRDDEFLHTSFEEFLVQVKVTQQGTERVGVRKIYFYQDDSEFIQYKLDTEYSFIGDESNLTFNTDSYSEITVTLMDDEDTPSVINENSLVTLEQVDDLNYTISATSPTEQLIKIKITTGSGVELVEYRTVNFYAHGTIDAYQTIEGIVLGTDVTAKLEKLHGIPEVTNITDPSTPNIERWDYLSAGLGFDIDTETKIVEKIYYYSTLYGDYPTNSPNPISELLRFKMGVVKMKHTTKSYGNIFEEGNLIEPTSDGNGGLNKDGLYYYDFENIGRFMYLSDGVETVSLQLIVQFISSGSRNQ